MDFDARYSIKDGRLRLRPRPREVFFDSHGNKYMEMWFTNWRIYESDVEAACSNLHWDGYVDRIMRYLPAIVCKARQHIFKPTLGSNFLDALSVRPTAGIKFCLYGEVWKIRVIRKLFESQNRRARVANAINRLSSTR